MVWLHSHTNTHIHTCIYTKGKKERIPVIHNLCTFNRRAMSIYEPLTRPTQNSSINDRFDFTRSGVLSMLLRILFRLFDVRRWDFRFTEFLLRPSYYVRHKHIWCKNANQIE